MYKKLEAKIKVMMEVAKQEHFNLNHLQAMEEFKDARVKYCSEASLGSGFSERPVGPMAIFDKANYQLILDFTTKEIFLRAHDTTTRFEPETLDCDKYYVKEINQEAAILPQVVAFYEAKKYAHKYINRMHNSGWDA